MKKPLLILIPIFLALNSLGQKINYQNTFNDALNKSKTDKKLVFVTITAGFPKPPEGLSPTSIRLKSGIEDLEVTKLYNKNFISWLVLYSDTAANTFIKKYQIARYPTYLFLDSRGNLVYRESDNSSRVEKYTDMAQKAIAASKSGKTLSDYENKYKKSELSASMLKEYISLRQSLEIFDNAKLVDEYVDFLTVRSFQNYDDVLFILKAGPFVFGKAYNLCYTNRKITDSIYKTEPADVRSSINQRIINNSINAAIENKNIVLAQQVANFISSSWSRSNFRQGQISSQNEMLFYYRSVKDTAAYYRQASSFYDVYYMNISADSARKLAATHLEALKKDAQKRYPNDTVQTIVKGTDPLTRVTTKRISMIVPVTTPNNSTANVLNSAAYQFFTLGTHNQNYLIKALLWSKRAIELNPAAPYFDTEAHLLYRLGFYDEAKSAQIKAIDMAQDQNKETTDRYKAELNKIETHQL